jgi:hypothetical protein
MLTKTLLLLGYTNSSSTPSSCLGVLAANSQAITEQHIMKDTSLIESSMHSKQNVSLKL